MKLDVEVSSTLDYLRDMFPFIFELIYLGYHGILSCFVSILAGKQTNKDTWQDDGILHIAYRDQCM